MIFPLKGNFCDKILMVLQVKDNKILIITQQYCKLKPETGISLRGIFEGPKFLSVNFHGQTKILKIVENFYHRKFHAIW